MLLIQFERLEGRSGHDTGRALLARMYLEAAGNAMPEIRIAPGGKPYFPGNPLYFSISHCKNPVFCALSDVPVGIDAEEPDRQVSPRLAEKILSGPEYERFLRCPDRNAALLRFWVLKEAAVKLTGRGLHGYPNQTDFSPDDPRIRILDGCPVAVFRQEEPHVI